MGDEKDMKIIIFGHLSIQDGKLVERGDEVPRARQGSISLFFLSFFLEAFEGLLRTRRMAFNVLEPR